MSAKQDSGAKNPITYRDAGVNIDAGNDLIDRIKPAVARTQRPGVLGGLGGFGALFEIPLDRYHQPVLVSGTDGVGTKLKLASIIGKHDTIGIDLVAMCVNDIIVQGAEPLFFLDYYATGSLELDNATDVINGIARGCELAGAALVGGETAEMPGMYAGGDYDLAGFSVGIVEKSRIIDGSKVAAGDRLIGLASSGPHSNGYSLIRRLLEHSGDALDSSCGDTTLGEALLEPTRIYVKNLLQLLQSHTVHALAHITGGGLTENLPRVLPENTIARIDPQSWQRPPVFDWIQSTGSLPDSEMLKTFNCGIGMILCLPANETNAAVDLLKQAGETVFDLGSIESATGTPHVEYR